MQVVAALDSTYAIGLPESWFVWTRTLRFLGELDWANWLIPSSCIIGRGMIRLLLLRALAPLAVIVMIPVAGSVFSTVRFLMRAYTTSGREGVEPRDMARGEGQPDSVLNALVLGLLNGLPLSLVFAFCFTPSGLASSC
jgi:hypothetical protein